MERRKAVRFVLEAPVEYRWSDPSGQDHQSSGWIRDISVVGAYVNVARAYVVGDALPPEGAMVHLEIYLPPVERNAAQRLVLDACAKTLRVADQNQIRGFAVRSEFILREELPKPCTAGGAGCAQAPLQPGAKPH